jgi:choline transport protein
MPLLARLISLFGPDRVEIGGLYNLGKLSIPLNVVGLLFLVFASITFNFPTVNPVTSENMNYDSAAIGVIMIIALVTWLTTGRKNFTRPESGGLIVHHGNDLSEPAEPSYPGIPAEEVIEAEKRH